MRIDVYDFDGTIYDGDSTVDFTRFCLRRHPGVLAGPLLVSGHVGCCWRQADAALTQFKSVLFWRNGKAVQLETEAELFGRLRRPEASWAMVF